MTFLSHNSYFYYWNCEFTSCNSDFLRIIRYCKFTIWKKKEILKKICFWFSSAPQIISSGLASWKQGRDSLPHPVKLPIHFTYLSTCLNVDVLSTLASVCNKPTVILTLVSHRVCWQMHSPTNSFTPLPYLFSLFQIQLFLSLSRAFFFSLILCFAPTKPIQRSLFLLYIDVMERASTPDYFSNWD